VIDSALETFRDRLERSGVALERRLEGDGLLEGDAEKLRRVVINLVGNAVDALEEGATPDPRVEVSMGENLAGTAVWVRIRDNGPGIDPEARQKMFSPFYTSKTNGTGLGLAICRKLVEAHAGSIEVVSEPGRGAEFVLTFPKQRSLSGEHA
jgi:signal transduction histidine kinase